MKSAADLERLRAEVRKKVRLRAMEKKWIVEISMATAAIEAGARDLLMELLAACADCSLPLQVIQNGNLGEGYRLPVLKLISPQGRETIFEDVHADDLAAILSLPEKGE